MDVVYSKMGIQQGLSSVLEQVDCLLKRKKKIVDSEMAQGIKLVTIKPVDPCWVPGTHRVDGESKLLQAVL